MRPAIAILAACLFANTTLAAEVPPSQPLRVRRVDPNYRWEAASTASRNGEIARRYNLGQDLYTYCGGWYRPTNYFSQYTYRGVPDARINTGYGPGSLNRFYGPVPTRWLRRN